VTLVWEVAVLLDIVVPPAGIAGAKMALFRRLRGRIGRGRVGGCVHVIGTSDKGWFWGGRQDRGLGVGDGRVVGSGVVVGVRGV
jgi:hypothetical protein